MDRERVGDGEPLVLVLGWGNGLDHDNVRWLIDLFVDDGYRVHAFAIPDAITDFDREYLAPVADCVADLDGPPLVGHSTGGLIGAFVEDAATRTFLSPWWGFPAANEGPLLSLVTKLPTDRPLIPSGTADRRAIGDLATDEQLADGPDGAAPTFLREARRAQGRLPERIDDAAVFCTLRDEIVSVRAIGDRVPARNVQLYDGGHELFSSSARTDHREALLRAVGEGPDGG